MAAWSTCGFERRQENEVDEKRNTENKNNFEEEHGDVNFRLHRELGLTSDEQREIGKMCKRLIDQGRILYLRSHGYNCKLIEYINSDITPENISLMVTRTVNT